MHSGSRSLKCPLPNLHVDNTSQNHLNALAEGADYMLCVSILGGRTEGKRRNLIEHSGNLLRLGLFVLGFIKMSFIFQVGHSRLREQRHENCIVYLRMIRHLTSLERILTEVTRKWEWKHGWNQTLGESSVLSSVYRL